MPFAWAARPIFNANKVLDNSSEFSALFRQDKAKLGEDELLKNLAELHKTRSTPGKFKLPTIPGQFVAKVHPLSGAPQYLTPGLVPVAPYAPSDIRPCREIQSFPVQNALSPLMSYHNFLYVYPIEVDFTNASTSSNRARNIVCRVELFENDDGTGQSSLPAMFGRSFSPKYTTSACTTVSYHSPKTNFYDEIKISLPVQPTTRHHLLFTFSHVSVDSQKKDKNTETVIGYSFIPLLLEQGRMEGEFDLPVIQPNSSAEFPLPPNYLRLGVPGAGDRSGAKFVDGGKPVFKLKLVCNSSVYARDDHLRRFFRALDIEDGSDVAVRSLRERIKALHAVHPNELMQYFPVLFNTLFALLTRPSVAQSDAQLEIVKFLVFLAEFVRETGPFLLHVSQIRLILLQRARNRMFCCTTMSTTFFRRP